MRLTKIRLAAAAIAVAVAVTLALRFHLTIEENHTSVLGAAWINYRFFTIWTNTLVGVVALGIAMGRIVPHWLTAGSALSIALVAGVYHTLLAEGRQLEGLDLFVDSMLHTVIPAAFIALWLLALPKGRLAWRDLVIWAAYPIVYSVYAILRGLSDGVYPYFFLNLEEMGAGGVAGWVAGLALVFLAAGVVMIFGARMGSGRDWTHE